ncbi:MAG: hypothetical protein OH354_04670 [Candidatus Parvarchaeota archaeon]|nr:hypothetical protein [Candidatus Jingweiarchaeum tengchongense]
MANFVFQGSRKNCKWGVIDYFFKLSKYTERENVFIWGFHKKEYYQKVKEGDLVFLKVNKNGSKDYGIFGMGKIVGKFIDDTRYWPEEFESNRLYKWKIKIGELVWISGLEEKVKSIPLNKKNGKKI